ncbi:MAG: hypothetical protein J6N49_00215 [Alphaproteobacteria bacterium]|nr:hypothetical protein [Alphaproteobacteria bacterium]
MDKKQLQEYKQQKAFRAIPQRIKQIILAVTIGLTTHTAHAQSEQTSDQKTDTIEKVISTYDEYKQHHLAETRAPFMHILDNMLQERVQKMQPAERADRRFGKYCTSNRRKALQNIFGSVPTACLRFYCAFAAFNTIKDAAIKSGCPEYARTVDKLLSNMNSCPQIIKDLNAACKDLHINNPKGLTVSQRMERDAADNRIGAGVYACIVRSTGNTRSGLHFKLCVAQVDDNGQPVRDPETKGILCTEYSFNRSSAETTSNAQSVPVAMYNLTDIADKSNEIPFLQEYFAHKQQFNKYIAESTEKINAAAKRNIPKIPTLQIREIDTKIY